MSTVMRLELMERETNDNPIRVGIIGAGTFGGLTIQCRDWIQENRNSAS